MNQYKDHLGNVRLSYTQNPQSGALEILEESHYYPFGLQHGNYNTDITKIDRDEALNNEKSLLDTAPPTFAFENPGYKYKFQGQEHQDEFGLNWDSFKWRNYMPDIGRFFNVDPLTEDYPDWGPYVFSGNRVIDAREMEGLQPHSVHKDLNSAATNFAQQYNGISIRADREVGTRFYSTTVNGKTTYSYTTPYMGTAGFVDVNNSESIPENAVQVGSGHTHGTDQNIESMLKGIEDAFKYGSNFPSNNDFDNADEQARSNPNYESDYTVTPNGQLLEYKPNNSTGDDRNNNVNSVSGASESIPSDTHSRTRQNNISPNVTPVVLPVNVDKDIFPIQ